METRTEMKSVNAPAETAVGEIDGKLRGRTIVSVLREGSCRLRTTMPVARVRESDLRAGWCDILLRDGSMCHASVRSLEELASTGRLEESGDNLLEIETRRAANLEVPEYTRWHKTFKVRDWAPGDGAGMRDKISYRYI